MAKAITVSYKAQERAGQVVLGRIINTLVGVTGKDKKEVITKLIKVTVKKDRDLIKYRIIIGGKITPTIAASVGEALFRYGCGKEPRMEVTEIEKA